MPRNVEIKAQVPDWDRLITQVEILADSGPEVLNQTDTFYRVPSGRLKLRRFAHGDAELIFYRRGTQTGAKLSEYQRVLLHDPDGMNRWLTELLGQRGVVRKIRHVYHIGQTRVHLDQVEGLGADGQSPGHFLELEVVLREEQAQGEGEAIASHILRQLEIPPSMLMMGSYIDLQRTIEPGG